MIKIYRGIQASGKSTEAINWARGGNRRVRLNRDDLRESFFGKRHGLDKQQEDFITKVQLYAARRAVRLQWEGVVVDATNLVNRLLRDWFRVGGRVEFQDFPIDLDDAIARDALREHAVGAEVIRKFHGRLGKGGAFPDPPRSPRGNGFRPYNPEAVKDKPYAILVDVDGTLAHNPGKANGGRDPYDYSRVDRDLPIRSTIATIDALVHRIRESGGEVTVFAFSGRDDSCTDATWAWFKTHQVPIDQMHMRVTGDTREDAVVKHEMFWQHIGENYDMLAVFDDREGVCRMWHEIGLPLMRVGDPESDF